MATQNFEKFQEYSRFAVKSFFEGCFSCMGAIVTTVIVLTIVGLLLGSIFGPTIIQTFNTVVNGINSFLQNLISILAGNKGPFPVGNQSAFPTPTGELPPLEIYMTKGNDPLGKPLDTITQSESPQLYFWVKADKGVSVTFSLQQTRPDGSKAQFGTLFTTKTDGSPLSCGTYATLAPIGVYHMDALIGDTVVGELTFTVTPKK
jgi:hypothetical protein